MSKTAVFGGFMTKDDCIAWFLVILILWLGLCVSGCSLRLVFKDELNDLYRMGEQKGYYKGMAECSDRNKIH